MAEQPKSPEKLSKLTADVAADDKLKQRLREQPLSVFEEYGMEMRSGVEVKELGDKELSSVTGGLKWTPTENSDVIDARGGQFKILGFTITVDGNGKISSVTR
jgi:bacteriocin-like protein